MERLHEVLEMICRPPLLPAPVVKNLPLWWQNGVASVIAWRALTEGLPTSRDRRVAAAHSTACTSRHDAAPLRATLERLVDSDRINDARSPMQNAGHLPTLATAIDQRRQQN